MVAPINVSFALASLPVSKRLFACVETAHSHAHTNALVNNEAHFGANPPHGIMAELVAVVPTCFPTS